MRYPTRPSHTYKNLTLWEESYAALQAIRQQTGHSQVELMDTAILDLAAKLGVTIPHEAHEKEHP